MQFVRGDNYRNCGGDGKSHCEIFHKFGSVNAADKPHRCAVDSADPSHSSELTGRNSSKESRRGDSSAANDLLPLVYEDLRKLAAARVANEAADHTLQPTALVHEAWLRLAGSDAQIQFTNRSHFFAAAAEAMRRILIERARRKSAEKRGGDWQRIDLDKVEVAAEADDDTLRLVNEAIDKLAKEDAKAAEAALVPAEFPLAPTELVFRSAESVLAPSKTFLPSAETVHPPEEAHLSPAENMLARTESLLPCAEPSEAGTERGRITC